jgi:hypothetical protein
MLNDYKGGFDMKNFILGLLLGIILQPFIDIAIDWIECLKLNSTLKILKTNAEISNYQTLLETQLQEMNGTDVEEEE